MSETETPRLLGEVPDRTRNKPEVYRVKLRQATENAARLLGRTRILFSAEGTKYLINPALGPKPGNIKEDFYTTYPLILPKTGRGVPISAEPE